LIGGPNPNRKQELTQKRKGGEDSWPDSAEQRKNEIENSPAAAAFSIRLASLRELLLSDFRPIDPRNPRFQVIRVVRGSDRSAAVFPSAALFSSS